MYNKRNVMLNTAKMFQGMLFVLGVACIVFDAVGTCQGQNVRLAAEALSLIPTIKVKVKGTIMLDPGHGGSDPGAISCLGYYEKDLTLKVANRLASELKSAGWKVIMTRDTDIFVSLDSRVVMANKENPNLFISIHGDSFTEPEPSGCTIFTSKVASDKSATTAMLLSHAMPVKTNRGVKQYNYRVLYKTKCPAVLIEMGFLSNTDDAMRMKSSAWQKQLARKITQALEVSGI